MAKCKYPNEICENMTIYHGTAYCDSVPCSLKDELPKKTNYEKIKGMSVEELAEFLLDVEVEGYNCCSMSEPYAGFKEWLESECDAE